MIEVISFSLIAHAFLPILSLLLNSLSQLFLIRIIKIDYLKSIIMGFLIGLIIINYVVMELKNSN